MNYKNLLKAKMLFALVLLLTSKFANAQMPFNGENCLMIGEGLLSGKHNGLIAISPYASGSQPQPSSYQSYISGKGSHAILDFKIMSNSENSYIQANVDGILYFILGAVGVKRGDPFNDNPFGSYTDKNLTNLTNKTGSNANKTINISNFNNLNFIGTSVSKYGLMLGGELDIKTIGTTSTGFTWRQTNNGLNDITNLQGIHAKTLIGPVIGYRARIKKLTTITTITVTRNIKNGEYAISSNPSITSTLYFGKNKGFYSSFHFEKIYGPKYKQSLNGVDRVIMSQIELKVGFYITN